MNLNETNPAGSWIPAHRPFALSDVLPRLCGPVAVLGPHPDDFDEPGVTLSRLHAAGLEIRVVVLSGGASGVQDEDAQPPTDEAKAARRREEQRASVRFFGLPDDRLEFMPLEEDADGEPAESDANRRALADWLRARAPRLVFLPHGNDEKGGHRNVYRLFVRAVADLGLTVTALLVRDPKTVRLRTDAYSAYGESEAAWKSRLLRFHVTQHNRNLRTRGRGFDERILGVDRRAAAELGLPAPYAESFELESYRDGSRI